MRAELAPARDVNVVVDVLLGGVKRKIPLVAGAVISQLARALAVFRYAVTVGLASVPPSCTWIPTSFPVEAAPPRLSVTSLSVMAELLV